VSHEASSSQSSDFETTHDAMRAERTLEDAAIEVTLIPTPRPSARYADWLRGCRSCASETRSGRSRPLGYRPFAHRGRGRVGA